MDEDVFAPLAVCVVAVFVVMYVWFGASLVDLFSLLLALIVVGWLGLAGRR